MYNFSSVSCHGIQSVSISVRCGSKDDIMWLSYSETDPLAQDIQVTGSRQLKGIFSDTGRSQGM